MLLNHKEAIDFIVENADYLILLSVSKIEDIHSILMKEFGVYRDIRKRCVGISGINYRTLDNEFHVPSRGSVTQKILWENRLSEEMCIFAQM